MPEATQGMTLAAGWISHFFSADRGIRWGNIEAEHSMWLDEDTLLVGRIDADGTDDEGFFWGDWKTLSARMVRRIGEVKAEYAFHPQMLTYGVLQEAAHPGSSRFLVRWACKTDPPVYFSEYYAYNAGEIAWWKNVLCNAAAHIHYDLGRGETPWMTNLNACRSKYGPAYNCPYLGIACDKQRWTAAPIGAGPRGSHLEIERAIQASKDGLRKALVIDATRVTTWLACNERYRREYHDGPDGTGLRMPPGEALDAGTEMHDILHKYYLRLKGESK